MRRRGAAAVPIGIKGLTFARGPDGSAPLPVNPTPAVVLVGPNNSGKSLALREVEAFCSTDAPESRVLSDVQIDYPESAEEAMELLDRFKAKVPPGMITQSGQIHLNYYMPGKEKSRTGIVSAQEIETYVRENNKQALADTIIKWYTIRLDGRTRLSLTDNQPAASLQDVPANHLVALLKYDARRERMREMTKEALGYYFTIDPTVTPEFAIRLSRRPPRDIREERCLDDDAVKFHAEAQHISEFSDGVNAFVGLTAAVMSLDLVVEPVVIYFGRGQAAAARLRRFARAGRAGLGRARTAPPRLCRLGRGFPRRSGGFGRVLEDAGMPPVRGRRCSVRSPPPPIPQTLRSFG